MNKLKKRIIGIILAVLLFGIYWVGFSLVFYTGGVKLWISIIIPPALCVVAIVYCLIICVIQEFLS